LRAASRITLNYCLFVVLLLITILNCVAQAQTKTNVPRTVTDFYLQLPMIYVNDSETISKRRDRIEIEDAANGYLKL